MWSIYDTLMLVTGVIALVIAVLPVAGIPASTRLWGAVIGGGLIALSLFLGSLRSFRYPSLVMIGPVIALLALGVVVADARRRTRVDQAGLQTDEQGVQASVPVAAADVQEPTGPIPQAPVLEPVGRASLTPAGGDAGGSAQQQGERVAVWAEVNLPSTSAARLAEIAASYPEFGRQMLAHPNLYPELRSWIEQLPASGETG